VLVLSFIKIKKEKVKRQQIGKLIEQFFFQEMKKIHGILLIAMKKEQEEF